MVIQTSSPGMAVAKASTSPVSIRPLASAMRAVGITRAQLIRQVIFEGSLISSYGTVLGLVTGLWIGGGLIAIGQNATSIALNVPVLKLAVLAVGGVISGMIAAVLPAIRASRLPIQQTIARG